MIKATGWWNDNRNEVHDLSGDSGANTMAKSYDHSEICDSNDMFFVSPEIN